METKTSLTCFHRASIPVQRHKLLIICWTVFLILVYFIYIKRQYSNIFFESQFLHIDFLLDLKQNQLTAKGFFTTFGEHLFPGYNLVLAINYYLFDIWGGFDSIVYAVSLSITAVIVVVAIYQSSIQNPSSKTIIAFAAALLSLSPTNNPQWGMALAAGLGVTLFVIGAWLISTIFEKDRKYLSLVANLAFLGAIVLFLGGYSIGASGSIFLVLGIWVMHHRRIDCRIAATAVTILVATLIYFVLVNRYGIVLKNKPSLTEGVYVEIGRFGLLMIGASLIGKAFFERTQQLWPYYICGATIFYWSIHLFREYMQRPNKGRIFILAIASYSLINIFAVSLFRYRNGLDGALGQWYSVHTHFIGIAVCYFLLTSGGESKFTLDSVAKRLSLVMIFVFAVVGYYCDWKKSAYVSGWKNQFVAQAPLLLAFPDLIKNANDPMNTMLWNYPQAKVGADFLYSNKLWLFKNKPVISGLTADGWFESDKSLIILCPIGTKVLSFRAWRPDGWLKSVIKIRQAGGQIYSVEINNNRNFEIKFAGGMAAILIDGSNGLLSQPSTSEVDTRHLVAIVKDISCKGSKN